MKVAEALVVGAAELVLLSTGHAHVAIAGITGAVARLAGTARTEFETAGLAPAFIADILGAGTGVLGTTQLAGVAAAYALVFTADLLAGAAATARDGASTPIVNGSALGTYRAAAGRGTATDPGLSPTPTGDPGPAAGDAGLPVPAARGVRRPGATRPPITAAAAQRGAVHAPTAVVEHEAALARTRRRVRRCGAATDPGRSPAPTGHAGPAAAQAGCPPRAAGVIGGPGLADTPVTAPGAVADTGASAVHLAGPACPTGVVAAAATGTRTIGLTDLARLPAGLTHLGLIDDAVTGGRITGEARRARTAVKRSTVDRGPAEVGDRSARARAGGRV